MAIFEVLSPSAAHLVLILIVAASVVLMLVQHRGAPGDCSFKWIAATKGA